MTDERLPLVDLLAKAGHGDFAGSEAVLQMLTGADVKGLVGTGRHGARGPCCTPAATWAA
jgi:putative transposase